MGTVMDEVKTCQAIDMALAVAAAVIVAYGVLMLGWSVFVVIALFWFENVLIGVLNVAKMLITGAHSGYTVSMVVAVALSAFFAVHYGMFTVAHGVFVVGLFGQAELGSSQGMFAPLGRMLAAVTFTNELWFNSVRLFTNGPYWSLGYEFW